MDVSAGSSSGKRPGPRSRRWWARLCILPAGLLLSLVVGAGAGHASDGVTHHCWTVHDPGHVIFRCRIDHIELLDLPGPLSASVPLYPAVGEDIWGECWFHSDVWSGWRAFGSWTADSALLVFGDGLPGGPFVEVRSFRRCSTDVMLRIEQIMPWETLGSLDYSPAVPGLQPTRGVVMVPVFPTVVVPATLSFALGDIEGNEGIFLEVSVVVVELSWGGGAGDVAVVHPAEFRDLSGYPAGAAAHVYTRPGSARVEVRFEWSARWRFTWDDIWYPVAIGKFATARDYAIDEIVGRVIG